MYQITLDDFIAEMNPWNYMRRMFEAAPLMITEDASKTARILSFEAHKAARVDGLMAAAERRRTEANRRFNNGFGKLDAIPFGQPIHGVRDRNYRRKACAQIDKGIEIGKEADAFEERARAAENNHAIFGNDPMAIEKLTEKLDKLQKAQEQMKAVNAWYRKHKTLDGCPAISEKTRQALKKDIRDPERYVPFTWGLKNNGAEIRRIKQRIEELQRKQTEAPKEWSGDGWTAETDTDADRIRIYFDGKPDDATRLIVKRHGFRWSPSAGAWQRQDTRAGRYAMQCVAEELNKS